MMAMCYSSCSASIKLKKMECCLISYPLLHARSEKSYTTAEENVYLLDRSID